MLDLTKGQPIIIFVTWILRGLYWFSISFKSQIAWLMDWYFIQTDYNNKMAFKQHILFYLWVQQKGQRSTGIRTKTAKRVCCPFWAHMCFCTVAFLNIFLYLTLNESLVPVEDILHVCQNWSKFCPSMFPSYWPPVCIYKIKTSHEILHEVCPVKHYFQFCSRFSSNIKFFFRMSKIIKIFKDDQLRLLDTYASKIAKICDLKTFWPTE